MNQWSAITYHFDLKGLLVFEQMLNSIYRLSYNEATIIRTSQLDCVTLAKKLVESINIGGFSVTHDNLFTKISIGERHVYIVLAEDYREVVAGLVMLGTAIGQIIYVDGFEWFVLPDKYLEVFEIVEGPSDRIYSLVRDVACCGRKAVLVSRVRPVLTVVSELHTYLSRHGKNVLYKKYDAELSILTVGKLEDSFRVYICGNESALPSFETEPEFKVVYR